MLLDVDPLIIRLKVAPNVSFDDDSGRNSAFMTY
jgi:hypothetical protein